MDVLILHLLSAEESDTIVLTSSNEKWQSYINFSSILSNTNLSLHLFWFSNHYHFPQYLILPISCKGLHNTSAHYCQQTSSPIIKKFEAMTDNLLQLPNFLPIDLRIIGYILTNYFFSQYQRNIFTPSKSILSLRFYSIFSGIFISHILVSSSSIKFSFVFLP